MDATIRLIDFGHVIVVWISFDPWRFIRLIRLLETDVLAEARLPLHRLPRKRIHNGPIDQFLNLSQNRFQFETLLLRTEIFVAQFGA